MVKIHLIINVTFFNVFLFVIYYKGLAYPKSVLFTIKAS